MNTSSLSHNSLSSKATGKGLLNYSQPLVMGIVNVTPDSFSDGGEFIAIETAVEHALSMVADGADIIDIGGESSRPGAQTISLEEELQRVIPVVEALRKESNITISIDTTKSIVASESLNCGADIINDISAGLFDPQMIPVVAEQGAGYIIMHMRGTPQTMQSDLVYDDVVTEISQFLQKRYIHCLDVGIKSDRLLVDPGIGFGKTASQNLELLKNLSAITKIGAPVLVGVSRKSFIPLFASNTLNTSIPKNRLGGSLAAALFAIEQGASVIRVHDVLESAQALQVLQSLRGKLPSRKEALN